MKLGAVAILDALGFKGIWKREQPELVIGKLRRLRDRIVGDIARAQQTFPAMLSAEKVTRQAAFLSDSLVVAVSVEPGGIGALGPIPLAVGGFPDLVRQDHSLRDLLLTLAPLIDVAATAAPCFAYRGVIACGEFEFEDVFVLGEAIDEAAALASTADGAFVWLAPSANEVHGQFAELNPYSRPWDALAPVYDVPMKEGRLVRTRVLNPFADREPSTRGALVDALLATFGTDNEDVQRKRRNTEVFLRTFMAQRPAGELFKELLPRPPGWKGKWFF